MLFGGTLGLASAANAGLQINGQFYNAADSSYDSSYAQVQTGGGVVSTGGGYWNGLSINSSSGPSSLRNAANQVTGVTFSQSGAFNTFSSWRAAFNGFAGTANENLMNTYAFSWNSSVSSPVTFSLSGLTAGTVFDFYVYTQGDIAGNGRQLGMTVQGSTQVASAGSGSSGTFILGQNYLKFSNVVVDSAGKINGSWWKAGGNEANWNGFQLVQTGAVPAPGAAALVGLAGLVGGRRRKA